MYIINCPKCKSKSTPYSLACYKCGRAIRANIPVANVSTNKLLDLFSEEEIEALAQKIIDEECETKMRKDKFMERAMA